MLSPTQGQPSGLCLPSLLCLAPFTVWEVNFTHAPENIILSSVRLGPQASFVSSLLEAFHARWFQMPLLDHFNPFG